MNEIDIILKKVDSLFLLNLDEKKEFKDFILNNFDLFDFSLLFKNLNEKLYINNYLKEILLNKNIPEMTFLEIHNNMRKTYLKNIRELEEREEENIENILNNL